MMQKSTPHTARRTPHSAAVSAGCFAWFAGLMLTPLPPVVFAQAACPGMHVQILNIRNSTGTVDCAPFESPEGFPTEVLRSATRLAKPKRGVTSAINCTDAL